MTIHDNGDNYVYVEIGLSPSKKISLVCDMYLPVLEGKKSDRVMMASAGNMTVIKEIKAKILQR